MYALDMVKKIRERLTKEFPEFAFCGKGYTIKMLDDDLKELEEKLTPNAMKNTTGS